jgi:hypothetical protein
LNAIENNDYDLAGSSHDRIMPRLRSVCNDKEQTISAIEILALLRLLRSAGVGTADANQGER